MLVSHIVDFFPKVSHYSLPDAGKSTIGGQLMYLTNMVDKRTLEKYEKEAKEKNRETWYLSWCMDTNQEERDKGKTVEVGRAYFETDRKHFTILDAPGQYPQLGTDAVNTLDIADAELCRLAR